MHNSYYYDKTRERGSSATIGNDANEVVTIETKATIFQEMFKQQQQVLIETVNSAATLTNVRINKLSAGVAKNSEKLIQCLTTNSGREYGSIGTTISKTKKTEH